jgi:hypothetical protein
LGQDVILFLDLSTQLYYEQEWVFPTPKKLIGKPEAALALRCCPNIKLGLQLVLAANLSPEEKSKELTGPT